MAAEEDDRDVTLGEVYRLVKGIDRRFDNFSNTYVPTSLFQAAEKAHSDRYATLGRELATERQERKAEVRKLEDARDADKRTKSQQWFAISLAGLVAIFGVIGTIASNMLLQSVIQGGP